MRFPFFPDRKPKQPTPGLMTEAQARDIIASLNTSNALSSAIRASYHGTTPSTNRRTTRTAPQSALHDITPLVRTQILGQARELERSDGRVDRFLDLVEQYAIGPKGLRIQPATSDAEFNKWAENAFEGWSQRPELSSRRTFSKTQTLAVRRRVVDGEIYFFKTYSPESGRPRIQLIEGHRIATPPTHLHLEGTSIVDGVELNSFSRPIAYWVRDDSSRFSVGDFRRIPAEFIVDCFRAHRVSQYRGLSDFFPVLADLQDLQELQALEMKAAKANATVDKVVYNETGEIEIEGNTLGESLAQKFLEDPTSLTEAERAQYYKEAIGPETWIAKNGDKIEVFHSNRPSVAVQQFWDYVDNRAVGGLGIPLELVSPRSLQGTMVRAVLDMANDYFRGQSALMADAFADIYQYVIAQELDANPSIKRPADWRKWRFTPPKSIKVDLGYIANVWIELHKMGAATLQDFYGELGEEWDERLQQRTKERKRIHELATAANIDPGEIQMLDPNEISSRQAHQDSNNEGDE